MTWTTCGAAAEEKVGWILNAEIILAAQVFLDCTGDIRPNFGLSVNTQGDTSSLYGGILWEWETKSGVFFDLGLGAAVHNGKLDTNNENKNLWGHAFSFAYQLSLAIQ